MNRTCFQKKDWLLLGGILLTALLLTAALRLFGGDGRVVEIYADGQLVEQIDCRSLTDSRQIEVNGVQVEVSPAGARVLSSVCPDQVCVAAGLLQHSGDMAVCAPQRVVVKLTGTAPDAPDAVVY